MRTAHGQTPRVRAENEVDAGRFRITVGPEQQASRFDHFLVANIPALSRSRLQNLIKAGYATLNGVSVKAGAKVRVGDEVVVREPLATPIEASPQQIAIDVLFEDDDLIVINKRAGIVVHPGAGNLEGTVVNALLHHCKSLSGIGGRLRPGIVHRLDKETSGCLVAAKTDLAHQRLAGQFERRAVRKIYLALVAGHFAKSDGVVEAPIGRHAVHRTKMAIVGPPRGRVARTTWRVLRKLGDASLLECTLHTGRTHQIRVHLAHLGHPVLGDPIYGKRGAFSRQMLHAWRLGFAHPRTGLWLDFESPIPLEFEQSGLPQP